METIRQLYELWKSLRPMTEENQARLDRKFNLEFNYNSNHLEGNTLTYGQTELLLMFGETSGDAKLRDYEEMQAHNVALKMTRHEAEERGKLLTEKFIRDLNELILVKPFYKDAVTPDGSKSRMKINIGSYKTRPNHVLTATGETFYYASPEETPAMMTALVSWYNGEEQAGAMHPVELASLLHYRFIRIHPFEDGNGRIARLLANYVLLRHDYPGIIIKSEHKEDYLRALHQSDIRVGLTPSDGANAELSQTGPFVDYMKEQMNYSLELCIKAANGESLDEPGDLGKKLRNLKNELGVSQEEVQLIYSDKTVGKAVLLSILPLLDTWEKLLQGFDTVVGTRHYRLAVPHYEKGIECDFDSLRAWVLPENNRIKYNINQSVGIRSIVRGITNIDNSSDLDGGSVIFEFHRSVYKVSNTANNKVITKMYHQSLSESEINEIVESLGNTLLESIEAKRV
jgi:Fic family protein